MGKQDAAPTPMTSGQFRAWRKSLGMKQKEVADLLGLKKRMIQYYEKGERDGKAVEIPKTVRLACYALSQGIVDFDGTEAMAQPADASRPGL
jgi:transcriptional regulator with XRE-family HTH domain